MSSSHVVPLVQGVISSDTVSGINVPMLVLRLTLRASDGQQRSMVVEVTKTELDAVLAKFDAIAKVRTGCTCIVPLVGAKLVLSALFLVQAASRFTV